MSKLQRVATLPRQSYIAMKMAFGVRAQYMTILTLALLMITQIIGVVIFSGKAHAYTADAFVTTWKTDNPGTSANNQIVIPSSTGGSTNYTVDWGDGNTTSGHTGPATHTYTSPGTYTVAISGGLPYFSVNHYGDREKLLSVEQWGTNAWQSMSSAFYGAKNLVINAVDTPNLTNVTNMSQMFRNAASFNSNINNWDVSHVTYMDSMFQNALSFNQPLNNWNTGNVTDMSRMFALESPEDPGVFTTQFNQDISSWNTSNVTTMSGMFKNNLVFNQPLDSWNTSSVTDMREMFENEDSDDHPSTFNQPLNSWNTSIVTDMYAMFYGATAFDRLLNNWDVSNVTHMPLMFANASSFNHPLNNWNVSNVTDMSGMFYAASAFNQSLNTWNTSSVTDVTAMFNRAIVFNQPLNNWDVSNITSTDDMFANALAFNQPLNSWDVSSVTDMDGMFANATSFNQPLNNWDVSNVTDMRSVFMMASTFDQSLADWDISHVLHMDWMFGNFDEYLEMSFAGTPYEDWPEVYKNLYGRPGSRLSPANYDATLVGWSQQTLHAGVTFSAGDSTYCNASAARQTITSLYNWTIKDGGQSCAVEPPAETEEPPGSIPQELLPILGTEEPTITDVTPAPGLVPPSAKTTPIKVAQSIVVAQNNIFALAKRIPEPFAIGFPWFLLALALVLVGIQYYQVHTESASTKRMQASVANQERLVEEQNNFVALSTHYLHTPLTVMEGEISLMVKAGTLTQAQATKLRATLTSLNAEAEATLVQEEQDKVE